MGLHIILIQQDLCLSERLSEPRYIYIYKVKLGRFQTIQYHTEINIWILACKSTIVVCMNVVHFFQTLYSFDQSRNYFNVTWSVVQIRSTERNNAIRSESQKRITHSVKILFILFYHSNEDTVDSHDSCRLYVYQYFLLMLNYKLLGNTFIHETERFLTL